MIRIRKNSTIVFLVLFLLMRWEINDFIGNGLTNFIENVARVFAALCSIYLYMKNRHEDRKISIVFLLFVLMQVWLLLSTILNCGSIYVCIIGYVCPLVTIGLLIESMTDNSEDIIQGSMRLSEILTYTNLVSIILFPKGIYRSYRSPLVPAYTKNWLLANRNDFIPYFLFFALIAFLYRQHGGKRWREWGIYIACLVSVFLVNSSTSIVGFTVLLVTFGVIKNKKIIFNTYFLVFLNLILFLAIVVFRLQNLFSFLIVDILGKSLTFTGRTILWDRIMPMPRDKFLLGFGVQPDGILQIMFGLNYAGQAHNLIYNHLYRGGIVYLGLYLAAMILVYRQIHKYETHIEAQAVLIVLFVFQIIALMEPYEKTYFIYAIYFIAYYVNRFISQDHYKPLIYSQSSSGPKQLNEQF